MKTELKSVEQEAPKKTYRCSLIPVEHCMTVWKDVRDLLRPAVERSHGRWTMEYMLASLTTGHQNLWVAYDEEGYICAAMTTQIVTYPNNKLLAIQFLGGTDFDGWGNDLLSMAEDYAQAMGCDGVEAVARFGFWPFFKKRAYDRSYVTYEMSFRGTQDG